MNNTENLPQWFGHPKGLFYLFFAELWERFSFYGMRALLVLYMVNDLFESLANSEEIAYGIYAAYGALVYATPVLGGMIADRIIGYRKSIMLGAVLMALGHFAMAIQTDMAFYGALGLLIVGNGFFKPNISTMVGTLYEDGDPRRDGGFTIFYMGINIGAMFSPLVCGWLGYTYGWHYGFGAAGIGMLGGLFVFWRGLKANILGDRGFQPKKFMETKYFGFNIDKIVYALAFLSVPVFALLVLQNQIMTTVMLALLGIIMIILTFLCFQVTKIERERLFVIVILTFFLTVFWAFFEQAGSSLTLFAERNVNLTFLNAAQTNSINPAYIIILAVPFSMMWLYFSKFRMNPITPIKFAMGIAQLGLGFLFFGYSAQFMDDAGKVPFLFLMIGYFFITTGELFVSPIGLSKTTELSPKTIAAFMMGVFFLSSAFAHHIAGGIAKLTTTAGSAEISNADSGGFMNSIVEAVTGFKNGMTDSTVEAIQSLATYTSVFTQIAVISFGFAFLALILTPLIRKWMHGVH